MALNIGEANALNTLMRFVSGDASEYGDMAVETSRDEAAKALELLLNSANKTLSAGYSAADADRLLPLEALS